MLPRNRKEKEIDKAMARNNDKRTSEWIDSFTSWEVEAAERKRSYLKVERPPIGSDSAHQCIHMGAGKGLGLQYLRGILKAGMRPYVVDWLWRALNYAELKISPLLEDMPFHVEDVLKLAEARRYFQDFNPELVKFIQMSRVAEHQVEQDAAQTFEGGGRILADEDSRFVIVGAFKCRENDLIVTDTSTHFSTAFVRHFVEKGAGRPIDIYHTDSFKDVADVVLTALTLQARPRGLVMAA
jgi:hypothetical protein